MFGKQRGEQIRAGAAEWEESTARSWIHWIGVLRSPCWDSAETRRNVLLFPPKCDVDATPWDSSIGTCGVWRSMHTRHVCLLLVELGSVHWENRHAGIYVDF